MGKGQRNKGAVKSASRGGDKNSIVKKIIGIGAVLIIAAGLIFLTIYNNSFLNGSQARKTIVIETENYKLSQTDMSYYFYNIYQNFLTSMQSYGLSISNLGIDTSSSLKTQDCSLGDGTWFDYFMSQAKESAKQQLALCEAANEEGISLEEEDYNDIKDIFSSLDTAAKNAGYSTDNYIKGMYGSTVSKTDLQHVFEISKLADKYIEKVKGDVDISDEALEAAYEEEKDSYDKVDYISYTFNYEDLMPEEETTATETGDSVKTEEEKEAEKAGALETISTYAAKIEEEATDEDSFVSILKEYFTKELGLSDEDADTKITSSYHKKTGYSESDLLKWAFEAEVNEITKTVSENEETITLSMLTSARHRDEDLSYRTMRHVLFSTEEYEDSSKADEVYKEWVDNGAKDEELIDLVKEYSYDTGVDGLYEDLSTGTLAEELDTWLFDESRVPGDHNLIKTTYGWHIISYLGGTEGWKYEVKSALQGDASDKALNDAVEKYEVTVDDEGINSITA